VKVPTLIGLDEAAAANVIKENLFTVGNVTYDNPDQKENARVYYQIPAPNTNYDQGQIIDIYLSAKSMDSLKSKIRELDYTFNRQYVKDTVTGQISSNQENPKISVPSKPAAEEAQKPKTPPKKVISE
jgi:beta-lactam-binding protein with PASTA domain